MHASAWWSLLSSAILIYCDRSLPDIEILAESSLMQLLTWSYKLGMDKSMSSSNGRIGMINPIGWSLACTTALHGWLHCSGPRYCCCVALVSLLGHTISLSFWIMFLSTLTHFLPMPPDLYELFPCKDIFILSMLCYLVKKSLFQFHKVLFG
jgi:hypothetical protein